MNDSGGVNWDALVPHLIHPTKVLIIEALLWIDRPMSAVELTTIFDGDPKLSLVSYHMKRLKNLQLLEPVGNRRVRGAQETYYYWRKCPQ